MAAEVGVSIKVAKAADVEAIAAMHVAAWHETYSGLVPDELLNRLSVEKRTRAWRKVLARNSSVSGFATFVAVNIDNHLVGFADCGPQSDEKLAVAGFDGEFRAIYLLQTYQRQGVGRRLMGHMARYLISSGKESSSLWVLDANRRARRFYEALGAAEIGEKDDLRDNGIVLHEIAYGWRDLSVLCSQET